MRDRVASAATAAPLLLALAAAGCSARAAAAPRADGGDAGRFTLTELDAAYVGDAGDAAEPLAAFDASFAVDAAAPVDASLDGPASRFITEVLSFTQGTCAGYGAGSLPEVVLGPPVGFGTEQGSTDVVSLGGGGSIVVGFGANAIVDGPGVDFIVFENPFLYGDGTRYAEPGEVAVSDDGVTWTAFPCADATQAEPDGGWGATKCAGINPVYSAPGNGISPFDVAHAGGDAYDLADLGVKHARFVRIRNIVASESCPDAGPKPIKNGFDLDAIALVNAALP